MSKRCLIMAGGTGGHVFPGLAVAHALQSAGWEIEWLGTAERMEADVVPKHGIPIHFIPVKGIRGKGLKAKLSGGIALIKSLFSARRIIKRVQPDLVLGFGGYASGPGGVAAKSLGIPVVIHEQNAAAGMTNKLLAKVATRVLLGFEDAKPQFAKVSSKVHTVGNPVRDEIWQVNPKEAVSDQTVKGKLNLLVVGGSLGAKVLNDTVPETCGVIDGLSIRHQCGKGNKASVEALYAGSDNPVEVSDFIDDMAAAYEWADFVICRAGALTVAEVAAAGRAALFVPLPHAVDDHQTKNAQSLVKYGAAIMIAQSALKDNLRQAVRHWVTHPSDCQKMGEVARQHASTHATEQVVSHCMAVVGVGE